MYSKNVDFGEQEVITSIPFDNGRSLKVSKVTYKSGAKAVDIRGWYTENGEEKPSKGIRIADENITEVLKAVIKAMSTEAIYDLAVELKNIVDSLENEDEDTDEEDDDDTEEDDDDFADYNESEDIM